MKRINIVVEGQAEETYINEVLSIHLAQFDVGAVARRVEFGRRKQRVVSRGGLFDYLKLRRDVTNWLKQDRGFLIISIYPNYYYFTPPGLFAENESVAFKTPSWEGASGGGCHCAPYTHTCISKMKIPLQ